MKCRLFDRIALGLAALWISSAALVAADITLHPSADTTLIEAAPDNNLGGQTFCNVGSTELKTRNRALYKFDLSSIPVGSTVQSAYLILQLTHKPNNGFETSEMQLHRMLRDWGEGNKATILSPGLGAAASTTEATWNSPFALTGVTWAAPGGLAGSDFSSTVSGASYIYGTADSPYAFSSTNLISDVQAWVNAPAQNFGWILISTSEQLQFTARRFSSREDLDAPPELQITFQPAEINIQNPRIVAGEILFEVTVPYAGRFVVESSSATSSWQRLMTIETTQTDTITIHDSASLQAQFYRVRSE